MTGYGAGFESVDREFADEPLHVDGEVPGWLEGSLIRNGPGLFESGGESVEHWFDGLALLRKFAFRDGTVRYTDRFLRSEAYRRVAAGEGMATGQFGTGPDAGGVLGRLRNLVPRPTDNTNVHTVRAGGAFVATTETPRGVRFDPETLTTRGHFEWDGAADDHWLSAHPVTDPAAAETFDLGVRFGRRATYRVTRRHPAGTVREPVVSLTVDEPAYTHSFAVSEDHVVLTEPPFVVRPLDLLTPWRGGGSFVEHFRWEPARGTRFHLFDRASGDRVATVRAPARFVFHHVNAFEDGDAVVVDLVDFPDDDAVSALSLESLREERGMPRGTLRRYRLPHDGGAASAEPLHAGVTLPRFDERRSCRRHRYVYGQSLGDREDFANRLAKVDARDGAAATWGEDGWYVGEPVFVPRPDGDAEDDGVVLAVALDPAGETSVLVVLDADGMVELARARLPHALPFDFHGRFYPGVG